MKPAIQPNRIQSLKKSPIGFVLLFAHGSAMRQVTVHGFFKGCANFHHAPAFVRNNVTDTGYLYNVWIFDKPYNTSQDN